MNIFQYVWLIIASPSFAEKQPWVHKIAVACSVIPANGWTLMRAPGSPVVIAFLHQGRPIIAGVLFLLFSLTDRVDGMVARLGEINPFGAKLDGAVDKLFILPPLFYLNFFTKWETSNSWEVFLLTSANLVLMLLVEILGRIWMFKHPRFDPRKDVFANYYGKVKFSIQVALFFVYWLAAYFLPATWWTIWINLLIFSATLLSACSAVFRIYPEIEKRMLMALRVRVER